MENQNSLKLRYSFKNATMVVCLFNLIVAFLLFREFIVGHSRGKRTDRMDIALQKYIQESEEIRRSMEPLELIKRVREIQQEAYTEPEPDTTQKNLPKQKTAAADLSQRLQDFRSVNDANSLKALEEWRKRKMERARQREVEKTEH